jgi:hypothetical protein
MGSLNLFEVPTNSSGQGMIPSRLQQYVCEQPGNFRIAKAQNSGGITHYHLDAPVLGKWFAPMPGWTEKPDV